MGRLGQIRANIRRAYDAGRATVRAARAEEERRYQEELASPASPPPPDDGNHSVIDRDDEFVPRPLRIAGAWAWRFLVIGIVLYFVIGLFARLTIVVIPLAIALLLAALLGPAVGRLRQIGVHRTVATTIVVIGGLAAVVGTLTLVIREFITGLPDLVTNAEEGLQRIQLWLKEGPLHLTDLQLANAVKQLQDVVNANRDTLTSGAISTAATALEIVSGMFLVLFALFFLLRDGRLIWRFSLRLVPRQARENLDLAGSAAWRSLVAYVRATVLVAFIDAVGIGVALWILDVPLALPLAALVFLTSFIPIIGATLSGAVAVLVALVTNGPITALLVLAAVITVQQIEGHLLQPLIMGRAVAIHPLAVIVSIATGLVLAGMVGALLAVPIIAVLNTGIRQLTDRRSTAGDEEAVVVKSPPASELG